MKITIEIKPAGAAEWDWVLLNDGTEVARGCSDEYQFAVMDAAQKSIDVMTGRKSVIPQVYTFPAHCGLCPASPDCSQKNCPNFEDYARPK